MPLACSTRPVRVIPIATADYPTPAPRPGLFGARQERDLGAARRAGAALARAICARICEEHRDAWLICSSPAAPASSAPISCATGAQRHPGDAHRRARRADLCRQPRQSRRRRRTSIFVEGDIRDTDAGAARCSPITRIDTIVHFAAESHVDRSIDGPDAFIDTNVDRHAQPAQGGQGGLARRGQRPAAPLPPRLDRRGLWQPRARRSGVQRDDALCAQLALFGVQGGERPSGARLSPYVRAARRRPPIARTITGPINFPKS